MKKRSGMDEDLTKYYRIIKEIERKLNIIAKRHDRQETDIDSIQLICQDFHERYQNLIPEINITSLHLPPRCPGLQALDKQTRNRLKKFANTGIVDLQIEPQPDGQLDIRIDSVDITLPPVLADLFIVLAEGTPAANDRFVPLKTLDNITRQMNSRKNKSYGVQTIQKMISKLRRILWESSSNPFFIQTNESSHPARYRLLWTGQDKTYPIDESA